MYYGIDPSLLTTEMKLKMISKSHDLPEEDPDFKLEYSPPMRPRLKPKPSPTTTMFPMKVPMMLPGAALSAIEEAEVESPAPTQGIDSAHTASTALSAPENIAQKQPPK